MEQADSQVILVDLDRYKWGRMHGCTQCVRNALRVPHILWSSPDQVCRHDGWDCDVDGFDRSVWMLRTEFVLFQLGANDEDI